MLSAPCQKQCPRSRGQRPSSPVPGTSWPPAAGQGHGSRHPPAGHRGIRFRGMPNAWLGTIPRLPRLLFLVVVVVLNVVWQTESPEHGSAAARSCPCPCPYSRDRGGACRKPRGAASAAGVLGLSRPDRLQKSWWERPGHEWQLLGSQAVRWDGEAKPGACLETCSQLLQVGAASLRDFRATELAASVRSRLCAALAAPVHFCSHPAQQLQVLHKVFQDPQEEMLTCHHFSAMNSLCTNKRQSKSLVPQLPAHQSRQQQPLASLRMSPRGCSEHPLLLHHQTSSCGHPSPRVNLTCDYSNSKFCL